MAHGLWSLAPKVRGRPLAADSRGASALMMRPTIHKAKLEVAL